MDKPTQCDKCDHDMSEKAESRSRAEFTETEQIKEKTTHDTNFTVKQHNRPCQHNPAAHMQLLQTTSSSRQEPVVMMLFPLSYLENMIRGNT